MQVFHRDQAQQQVVFIAAVRLPQGHTRADADNGMLGVAHAVFAQYPHIILVCPEDLPHFLQQGGIGRGITLGPVLVAVDPVAIVARKAGTGAEIVHIHNVRHAVLLRVEGADELQGFVLGHVLGGNVVGPVVDIAFLGNKIVLRDLLHRLDRCTERILFYVVALLGDAAGIDDRCHDHAHNQNQIAKQQGGPADGGAAMLPFCADAACHKSASFPVAPQLGHGRRAYFYIRCLV